MFDNNFEKILSEAERIYNMHKKNKGESWKELPIDALADGVKEEFDEWFVKYKETLKGLRDNKKDAAREAEEDQYFELLDIINSCMMYGERLRMRMKVRQIK